MKPPAPHEEALALDGTVWVFSVVSFTTTSGVQAGFFIVSFVAGFWATMGSRSESSLLGGSTSSSSSSDAN